MPENASSARDAHAEHLNDALALAAAPAEAAGFAYIALVEATAGALQNAVAQQQAYQLLERAQSATASAAILQTAIDLPPLVPGSEQALGLEAERNLEQDALGEACQGAAAEVQPDGEQTDALSMAAWAYEEDGPGGQAQAGERDVQIPSGYTVT